jgi:MOSC domain-containing protein YiiM
MRIISANIGGKRELEWKGKVITTAIIKSPVDKPIFLEFENVKGDTICDRNHHGGIDQAVYGYSLKHYVYWKELYPNLDWEYGMFGENLTIDDLDESELHVGDTFKVGEAIVEVTKPRQPCMKLGVRFNDMKIVKQFWKLDIPGVYFKIIQKGFVKAGDVFEQTKSYKENLTIAEVYNEKRIKKGIS